MNNNQQTGSPPCFILIRGLLREQRHWDPFPQILQQQLPDSRIITLDIPGNGQLNHQTSPNTIAGMTDALRNQLNDLKNLDLVTLSMGGMIALDWINRYPFEVKSAVLVNSSLGNISPFYRRLRWPLYPAIIAMLFKNSAAKERQILDLTSNHHADDQELLHLWVQWQQQNPVSKRSALNQLIAAAKFSLTRKPEHPLLIVASKQDKLVDYRCSQAMHQTWKTDYQQHSTAGHDLALDDPQWLAEIITSWFKGI